MCYIHCYWSAYGYIFGWYGAFFSPVVVIVIGCRCCFCCCCCYCWLWLVFYPSSSSRLFEHWMCTFWTVTFIIVWITGKWTQNQLCIYDALQSYAFGRRVHISIFGGHTMRRATRLILIALRLLAIIQQLYNIQFYWLFSYLLAARSLS